jgi:GLPGLI family protein
MIYRIPNISFMNTSRISLLALLLSLSAGLGASAQVLPTFSRAVNAGDSVDCVQLVAVYKMTYHYDPTDTATLVTDEVWLEIGHKVSKQYSKIMYDLDVGSEDQGYRPNTEEQILPIVLFDGLKAPDQVTLDYRVPLSMSVLRYTEQRPKLDWQLTGERRTIAGMECQGATCDFGGRHWTAWFAPKLPYPYGPYKLGGLPGLILEAYDSDDGEYHYTCIGFRPQEEGRAIVDWWWDREKTTKKELARMVRFLYASPEAALRALGINNVTFYEPMVDQPYNPIER